jgi:hypothetical protein
LRRNGRARTCDKAFPGHSQRTEEVIFASPRSPDVRRPRPCAALPFRECAPCLRRMPDGLLRWACPWCCCPCVPHGPHVPYASPKASSPPRHRAILHRGIGSGGRYGGPCNRLPECTQPVSQRRYPAQKAGCKSEVQVHPMVDKRRPCKALRLLSTFSATGVVRRKLSGIRQSVGGVWGRRIYLRVPVRDILRPGSG